MSKLVIFGTGAFAQCAHFYFSRDSREEVVGFTVNQSHLKERELLGFPVVEFERVESIFPPSDVRMFVAVGYTQVNRVRARIYGQAKAKGYTLASYLSSKCTHWGDTRIGDNCFIFEDNTIQPFVEIGNDVIVWSGNHLGHHAKIGDHCFITSHVVISGQTRVGAYSFVGVNATLRDNITIGEANILGAGTVIMRSTRDSQVFVAPPTPPDPRTSNQIPL